VKYISVFCLSIICLSCFGGLYWERYKDSWPQNLGLVGTGVWSGLRFDEILFRDAHPSVLTVLGQISLALFFSGTAYKAWRLNRNSSSFPKQELNHGRH
jgi:hypothetical protein